MISLYVYIIISSHLLLLTKKMHLWNICIKAMSNAMSWCCMKYQTGVMICDQITPVLIFSTTSADVLLNLVAADSPQTHFVPVGLHLGPDTYRI